MSKGMETGNSTGRVRSCKQCAVPRGWKREVRRGSWAGPRGASVKELGRVPRGGRVGTQGSQDDPSEGILSLFSLSEIGSHSSVAFSKVSSQVEFHVAGPVERQDDGLLPSRSGIGGGGPQIPQTLLRDTHTTLSIVP